MRTPVASNTALAIAAAFGRLLWALDRCDLDALGRIADLEDRIRRPIDARDAALVEAHFFEQCAAHALHDVALDRAVQAVRIDDEPAVVRDEEAPGPDAARCALDLDFADGGDVAAEAAIYRYAAAS